MCKPQKLQITSSSPDRIVPPPTVDALALDCERSQHQTVSEVTCTPIATLKGKVREKIKAIIDEATATTPDGSGFKGDMTAISSCFEMVPEAPSEKKPVTAAELAKTILEDAGSTVSVVYIPEPTDSRFDCVTVHPQTAVPEENGW